MTPLKSNVLIQLDDRAKVSAGGIFLADISKQAEEWGNVVAVGDKCRDLSVGDRVLVKRTQGTHYVQNGVDMILLGEEKVLAIDLG